jgi:ketosteroid isomerase-like protein
MDKISTFKFVDGKIAKFADYYDSPTDVICGPAVSQSLAAAPASPEIAAVQTVLAAWGSGKMNGEGCEETLKGLGVYADDVTLDFTGAPCDWYSGVWTGLGSICKVVKLQNEHWQVTGTSGMSMVQDGDTVFFKLTATYSTPDGQKGTMDKISTFKFVDGKIAKFADYYDSPTDVIC